MNKKLPKIEKLLEEFCPQGVEFRALGEVFNIKNGYTPSKIKLEYWTNGTIPWFRMEDIRKNGRVLNDSIQHVTPEAVKGSRLFPKNSIIIATSATIGEHALITVPYLSNQRFTSLSLKSDINDYFDIKFVFYYIFILAEWCRNNTTTSSFASVDMNGFKKFKIPIPPLTIQKEIVKILDNFTQLEAELEVELEAELEARKKQYEYCREQLLMVNDKGLMVDGTKVEFRALGEIMTIVRGASPRPIRSFLTNDKEGINWLKIGDTDPLVKYVTKTAQRITQEGAKKSRFLKKGDFILSNSMSFGRPYILKIEGCIHDGWIAMSDFEHIVVSDFLYYLLKSNVVQRHWKQKASSGTVQNLNADIVRSTIIPIPPLAKQQEIVASLDKFDALANDISTVLPAEIVARKKQYDYYRNQLLNFKPLEAQDAN